MKDPLAIAALAALEVVALGAIRLGWRHRVARSEASVGPIPAMPDVAALGEPTWGPAEATYVSTTAAGDWLADYLECYGASSAEGVFNLAGEGPICSWCKTIWPLCGHAHLSDYVEGAGEK